MASDGVKLAVNFLEPRIDGFQVQVAVKFGDVPDVEIFRHPGMRLPSIKKRIYPGESTLTEIVEEIPFTNSPEDDGVPIMAAEANPATALYESAPRISSISPLYSPCTARWLQLPVIGVE